MLRASLTALGGGALVGGLMGLLFYMQNATVKDVCADAGKPEQTDAAEPALDAPDRATSEPAFIEEFDDDAIATPAPTPDPDEPTIELDVTDVTLNEVLRLIKGRTQAVTRCSLRLRAVDKLVSIKTNGPEPLRDVAERVCEQVGGQFRLRRAEGKWTIEFMTRDEGWTDGPSPTTQPTQPDPTPSEVYTPPAPTAAATPTLVPRPTPLNTDPNTALDTVLTLDLKPRTLGVLLESLAHNCGLVLQCDAGVDQSKVVRLEASASLREILHHLEVTASIRWTLEGQTLVVTPAANRIFLP